MIQKSLREPIAIETNTFAPEEMCWDLVIQCYLSTRSAQDIPCTQRKKFGLGTIFHRPKIIIF